jgi:hypothetical protein
VETVRVVALVKDRVVVEGEAGAEVVTNPVLVLAETAFAPSAATKSHM